MIYYRSWQLTSCCWLFCEKLAVTHWIKNFSAFMDPEVLLLCSQVLIVGTVLT